MLDSLVLLDEYDQLFFPPHPDEILNTEYVLEAGFSQEAIDALQQIPYLSNGGIEFLPSTRILCWLDEDAGFYRNERDMLPWIEDEPMPPSAIKLSTIGLYRYLFIYDASTKLVHPWKPWDDCAAPEDYRLVPGKPAWGVFGPIILSYQKLEYIGGGPGGVEFFGPEGYDDDPNGPPFVTDDMTEVHCEMARELREGTKAVWELREIYLDCGWDVEAEGPVQPTFRRDELLHVERTILAWNNEVWAHSGRGQKVLSRCWVHEYETHSGCIEL